MCVLINGERPGKLHFDLTNSRKVASSKSNNLNMEINKVHATCL